MAEDSKEKRNPNKIYKFFKRIWEVFTVNKAVTIALVVFFSIVLFAIIGPMVTRDPNEQVRLWENIDVSEDFGITPVGKHPATIGQVYNISGNIPTDVLNSSQDLFFITGRLLTWKTLTGFDILDGSINFSLWRGNLSTYVANNDLVDTQLVSIDEEGHDYTVLFTLNITTENVESPYVMTFMHQGSLDYSSGDYRYETSNFDVIWNKNSLTLQISRSPSWGLPLGTDEYAYDTFARLAHATRSSLQVGLLAGVTATILSVVVGGIAGYIGRWTDETAQLIINILMVFPVFPLLIILAGFVESRSLFLVASIISVISWPWSARAIRAQILSLKERDFVRLAKTSAKRDWDIAIKELLPNMMAYIFLIFAVQMATAIAAEAGISMIGFGPDPSEHITLGTMLYWVIESESIRSGFWWLFVPPGLILTLMFVLLYILQSNLDEIFNPRLRNK